MITSDEVKKVAKLAYININDEEIDKYSKQLSAILDYINELQNVDTEGVEPTYNVSPNKSVFAVDSIKDSLSGEQALKNALNGTKNGFFVSKGVFKGE